jgi:hypothetical protein
MTAMQELIEEIRIRHNECYIGLLSLGIIQEAFEKEKEQIIDAYRIASINNAPNEDMQNIKPEYWQLNAEMWYYKHYNQNK